MINQPIQLRDLQPMQIGRTHNAKENKKLLYIMLKKDEENFTVFTTEKNLKGEDGIVMNCITKKLVVDICFIPEENVFLANYKYPNDEYERYRKRAIEVLKKTKRTLKPQEKILLFEIKANESIKKNVSDLELLEYGNTIESIQKLEEEARYYALLCSGIQGIIRSYLFLMRIIFPKSGCKTSTGKNDQETMTQDTSRKRRNENE